MYTQAELSILYELRAFNVKEEDIEYILERAKNRLTEKNIDIELEKIGYQKIFTVDYESYDETYDEYDFIDIKMID
jgi:hypothetical protein